MAAKKKRKAAVYKEEPCAYCAPSGGISNLQEWLLIILGGIGLANALGYINWPGFDAYFPTVFSVLVLVIGIKSAMEKSSCK
jgi:hypothetical protein